jgi:hypothetical protein
MDFNQFLSQHNLADVQSDVKFGYPILKMPRWQNNKYSYCAGKVKLSVVLCYLPAVLAFVASDGATFDPTTVSDADLAAILKHIQTNCRPSQEQNHE